MAVIEQRQPVRGSEHWAWPPDTHRVLRQVLSRREIGSPEDLTLALSRLTPVGEFAQLSQAVALLERHRARHVVIVGDFDADGATSTALMYLGLRELGFREVTFFLPDRFTLGYGLTPEVVERVCDRSPSLIVTVDNGISSAAGVEAAHDCGIEVLITDHHLPPNELPRADAIVNPNLRAESFRGKNLAGVGVAFYLLAALGKALGAPGAAARYLDLVALGTVADLVPLDRGNRILIRHGLERIRAGRCRPGVRALLEVAGIAAPRVDESVLAFQAAPRLNAAGRLEDMATGVRCLTTDSAREAGELASRLDALNRERRDLERRMRDDASRLVDAERVLGGAEEPPPVVCLYQADWHEGIVGLVASKIKDSCHRPTFAFAPTDGGRIKGSGRSVPGFHLRDALAEVDALAPGLIERFGGHAMAAGLTLPIDALGAFRAAIEEVGSRRLGPELRARRILTDGELAASDLTLDVARLLKDAGPWGQSFPEPRFEGRFELLEARLLKDAHLKMIVRPPARDAAIGAIAFNVACKDWRAGQTLRMVYRLAVNDYASVGDVELIVEHIEAQARDA
jgi:single-stranded-DNA-specific exonuclease